MISKPGTAGTPDTRLVVLRGNSASGKSSVAAGLREKFGRSLAIVAQDNLRRLVLRERDRAGGANIGLINLTAQFLHHGAHALVLDMKRISQPWWRELPTVTYRADVADIHDALTGPAAELWRRIDVVDRYGSDVEPLRMIVVFESSDATLRRLARHWETVRWPGDPRVSPAFTALIDVLFAGAMVRMNVFFDGDPMLTVLGLYGSEQFSTVILGRVPTGTWRRCAPAAVPAFKDRGRPNRGRVHVIRRGDTVRQTQVLTPTDPGAFGRATGAR